MSERITSHPLSGAFQALKKLDFEIGLLPKGEIRGNLRLDLVALSGDIECLPEKKAIVAYHTLHDQVTAARFERASAELADLHQELIRVGGGMKWNRQPAGKILTDWTKGPSTWPDSIDEGFELADEIYYELNRRIEEASRPRHRYPAEPKKTGRTDREAKKHARHLNNKAIKAEENRGHKKGASPGVDKHGKHGKGGKKGKRK